MIHVKREALNKKRWKSRKKQTYTAHGNLLTTNLINILKATTIVQDVSDN